MLFIFQFTDNSGEIFYWNLLNQQVLQKLKNENIFRTVLEQACHYHWFNQIDVGEKHGCHNWRDYEGWAQKALVAVSRWQIDSIIVWDSK